MFVDEQGWLLGVISDVVLIPSGACRGGWQSCETGLNNYTWCICIVNGITCVTFVWSWHMLGNSVAYYVQT